MHRLGVRGEARFWSPVKDEALGMAGNGQRNVSPSVKRLGVVHSGVSGFLKSYNVKWKLDSLTLKLRPHFEYQSREKEVFQRV